MESLSKTIVLLKSVESAGRTITRSPPVAAPSDEFDPPESSPPQAPSERAATLSAARVTWCLRKMGLRAGAEMGRRTVRPGMAVVNLSDVKKWSQLLPAWRTAQSLVFAL